MLGLVDTIGEGFLAVVRVNRHDLAGQHGAAVYLLVGNEMHHHPSLFDITPLICGQRIGNGMRAGELTRQGRMQIDYTVGEVA
jgi:hypothetical protein